MPGPGISNQFNRHKQVLFKFLESQLDLTFTGSNEELGAVVGEWGKFRSGVGPRQIGKYLKALEDERRISIDRRRFKFSGTWVNKRLIQVVKPSPVSSAELVASSFATLADQPWPE